MSRGGAGREETENPKQALGSQQDFDLINSDILVWAATKSQMLNWATKAPPVTVIFKLKFGNIF